MVGKIVYLYVSSASEDEALLLELEKHLHSLTRRGSVDVWHRGHCNAGEQMDVNAWQRLCAADIILCLISSHYLASDACYAEVKEAIRLHDSSVAQAILVLLRPVNLRGTDLEHRPFLPRSQQPVSQWTEPHAAWAEVADTLGQLSERLAQPAHVMTVMNLPARRLSSEQLMALRRTLTRIFPSPSSIRMQAQALGIGRLVDEPPDTMWYQILRQLVDDGRDLAPLVQNALRNDPRDPMLCELVKSQ